MRSLVLALLLLVCMPLNLAGATEAYKHHARSMFGNHDAGQLLQAHDPQGAEGYKKFIRWTIQDTYEQLSREEGSVSALEVNEEMIKAIGISGIMDILEEHDPKCHGLAHQVGRAAVRITKDINELVTACGLRCHTGCFHGVTLGLILDQPKSDGDLDRVPTVFQALCNNSHVVSEYGVGECLHASGHTAALVAGEEDMERGLEICMVAYAGQPTMQHYCGTGLFMEVIPRNGLELCTRTSLPGACFMYSLRHNRHSLRRSPISDCLENANILKSRDSDAVAVAQWAVSTLPLCLELETETNRAGCVYGLSSNLGERTILLDSKKGTEGHIDHAAEAVGELCRDLQGELLSACVEGFLLRNKKFYPSDALAIICERIGSVTHYSYERCVSTGLLEMYDLNRNVARWCPKYRNNIVCSSSTDFESIYYATVSFISMLRGLCLTVRWKPLCKCRDYS